MSLQVSKMMLLLLLALGITTSVAVIDEHRISQLEKKLEGLNLLERKFHSQFVIIVPRSEIYSIQSGSELSHANSSVVI
jgi:hypothetical protein